MTKIKDLIPKDLLNKWDGFFYKVYTPSSLDNEPAVIVELFNHNGPSISVAFDLYEGIEIDKEENKMINSEVVERTIEKIIKENSLFLEPNYKQGPSGETTEKTVDDLAKAYHEDKDTIRELLIDMSNYRNGKESNETKCPKCKVAMILIKQVHGIPVHFWRCRKCGRIAKGGSEMGKGTVSLLIDFIKKAIEHEVACHENIHHLDSDCTPVKERGLMEDAEHRLIDNLD